MNYKAMAKAIRAERRGIINQNTPMTLFDKEPSKIKQITLSLPAPDAATKARDEGIDKVSENESTWLEEAMALIRKYPHSEGTGEDIRIFVEGRIGKPHHVNVAGAFIMGAIRRGILTNTGVYVKMKRKESHARVNPLYIINR